MLCSRAVAPAAGCSAAVLQEATNHCRGHAALQQLGSDCPHSASSHFHANMLLFFLHIHHRIISCRPLLTLFKQNSTVTIQKYELQRQLAAAEQEAARSPVSHTSCASASARPELGLAITSSLNRGNDIVAGE